MQQPITTLALSILCGMAPFISTAAADVIDVGVVKIVSPGKEPAVLSTPQTIQIAVKNFGSASISADKFIVQYQVDNLPAVEERIKSDPIPVAGQAILSFSIPVDLSLPGEHKITAKTVVPADQSPQNDSSSVTIKSLAPKGGYEPPPTLPIDIGVVKVIPPTGTEPFEAPQTIQVVVKNFATRSISADEFIVEYKVNEGTFTPQRFPKKELAVGEQITLDFETKANFSKAGKYTIVAQTSLPADTNAKNDSSTVSITLKEPKKAPLEQKK